MKKNCSKLLRISLILCVGIVCFCISGEPVWQIGILLSAVIIHEGAHLIVLKLCKKKFSITQQPFGMRIRSPQLSYRQEAMVLFAGVTANLLAAIILAVIFRFFPNDILLLAFFANVALGVFNLLPISTLDGGNLVLLFLNMCQAKRGAYIFADIVSAIFAAALWLCGVGAILFSNGGAYLVFMSLWLLTGDTNK